MRARPQHGTALALVILLTLLFSPLLLFPTGARAQEQASGAWRLKLEPCRFPETRLEARCGTLTVPEDRGAPRGATITVPVVVLPATSGTKAREALFFFAGGPGASVTENAAGLARYSERSAEFAAMRERRDIVLLEQRGIGGSKPLGCERQRDQAPVELLLSDMLPAGPLRACREAVAFDPAHYSTAAYVADVEELRAALGYGKVHLSGVSYGTRVALAYMQAHPKRVASALLDGLTPEELLIPRSFARDAQAALEQVFAACAADDACRAAFPRFRQDFAELMRRLGEKPAEAVYRAKEGGETRVEITPHLFAITVRKMLYSAQRQATLPWMVQEGLQGRWDGFLEVAVREQRWMLEGIGLYLSIVCREDLAHVDPADMPELTRDTFLGDYWYRQLRGACAIWDPGGEAAPPRRTFTSNVPVLMISGGADPVTPPYWAQKLEPRLRNARHVILRDNAHGYFSECLGAVWRQLVEERDAKGLDVACMMDFRRPPFKTEAGKPE